MAKVGVPPSNQRAKAVWLQSSTVWERARTSAAAHGLASPEGRSGSSSTSATGPSLRLQAEMPRRRRPGLRAAGRRGLPAAPIRSVFLVIGLVPMWVAPFQAGSRGTGN